MKTVQITPEMTAKDRNAELFKVFDTLEENEEFRVLEELTLEALKSQMQTTLNIFQANTDIQVEIKSVIFDTERNAIVIERIYKSIEKNLD